MKSLHEALLYSSLPSGVCQCELCPRCCTIMPHALSRSRDAAAAKTKNFFSLQLQKENVGFCGTRVNIGGKLYAINYGRITSLAVDPSEKKPLYHFLPGKKLLSFGSFGCNFRCPNCHNWEISQTSSLIHNRPTILGSIVESFAEISPAEVVSQAIEYDCPGIAYTYNEPTVFLEFALEVMKLARKAKLKNIWVTNGFFSEQAFELVAPLLNAANVDLKSFDQHFYQSHCKASILPVIENLKKIKKAGIPLEITTLVIPQLNDSDNILHGIAAFIARQLSPDTPWHLIDFSPSISWQMQSWQSTDNEKLETAYKIGKREGLRFVYTPTRTGTYCPNCNALNIKRTGYEIERFDENGTCFKCGQKLGIE